MSRGLTAHLDEATLLRLVVADLDTAELVAAERHLRRCAACRRARFRTEALDEVMRVSAAGGARPAGPSGVLPSDDPFCRQPEPSPRVAREAGLDGGALVAAAIDASDAAIGKKSALLTAAKGEPAVLDAALNDLRFDRLSDRFTLGYLLSEAFDRVEDDPAAWRRFGEAALARLSKEPAVEGLNEMRPKPEEYAAPLAGLSAEAQLLVAASELLHAEFDAAGSRLEAAWKSLEGGKPALPLVARMETIASILRTISGYQAEGLALAERAAETSAVTGHPVDATRAEFARGLAEMAAGKTREGNVSLRRARGAFARSGSWGAFAMTVTALAVAETGPGDGPEFKSLFRAALGRLRRARALDAFQFLRSTHRVILLTRREPKRGKGTGAAKMAAEPPRFEPSLPYLMRGGDLLADGIVSAAREGEDALSDCLRALEGSAARPFALIRSCQKGSNIVGENPHRALALAHHVFRGADTQDDPKGILAGVASSLRQAVRAEAKIVEAQGKIQLGFAQESREAAATSRRFLEAAGSTGFGLALADYYEGQAAGFAKDYRSAGRLIRKALEVFRRYGQDQFMGRADGSLGTLYLYQGDNNRALPLFEGALAAFDLVADERPMAATLNNQALTLLRLGRYAEARVSYARALNIALKRNMKALVQVIREGLAEMDLRRGLYERALSAFSELRNESMRADFENNTVFNQLYVSECLGRLGREGEMAAAINALRVALKPNRFAVSPAMDKLFACLDQGALDADLVRNVREHFEREQRGERTPARLLRFGS